MTDERRQQEPTMEEILASIRRIISEDSRPAAGATPSPGPAATTPADTLGEPDATTKRDANTAASEPGNVPAAAQPPDTDPPLDLTLALPPAPDSPPLSPLMGGDYQPVLDLTNEVRDAASQSPAPERPTFLSREVYHEEEKEFERHERLLSTAPIDDSEPAPTMANRFEAPIVTPPTPEAPVSTGSTEEANAEAPAGGLLSASTEAATVSALARLRQAAARPQGPTPEQIAEAVRVQVAALLDEKFGPALDETLPVALAERLPGAIREQVGPLLRDRIDPLLRGEIAGALDNRLEPLLRDEIVGALNRRLDPMLREQATPLLRERADSVLREEVAASVGGRVEPLLNERLSPALNERLEPLLASRIEPLLRERLDPLLREWFDRNLPAIVERVVEREIERLVRQPGAN